MINRTLISRKLQSLEPTFARIWQPVSRSVGNDSDRPGAAGQLGRNRSSQTERLDSVQIEPARGWSPTYLQTAIAPTRERCGLGSDARGTTFEGAIPLDIWLSRGHAYDSDKGKPVRQGGTQSYRSKGVTA